MYQIVKYFGKPLGGALYALFAALAAKKKPWPLLSLIAMHAAEYFLVARKLAGEKGIPQAEAAANCLAFGFTWWLPIRKEG